MDCEYDAGPFVRDGGCDVSDGVSRLVRDRCVMSDFLILINYLTIYKNSSFLGKFGLFVHFAHYWVERLFACVWADPGCARGFFSYYRFVVFCSIRPGDTMYAREGVLHGCAVLDSERMFCGGVVERMGGVAGSQEDYEW